MSTILIPSNILRDAKKLFSRLKHLRCKLPVLNHLLLTAGQNGIQLAATDLDLWLETRISDLPTEYACFLIPPSAMEAACRADKGTQVSFTPCGGKRSRELRITLTSGGIPSTSVHPTLDPSELPSRPLTIGVATEVPPATLRGLADIAGCASADTTRQILNGVFFTPEDGGQLVATDGKRLACCPATVPPQSFILPAAACHILGHPDFMSDIATISWIDHKEPEKRHVAIQCGRHLLVSKPLVGNYPNYKQVIPAYAQELAVIPHDRKPGLIAWLRSLGKDQCSVRLDWHKRGQLTLSHRDANGHSATMQVPVEIHGNPPVIAFNARYLADALEIGSTLCLSDELSPGICRHPTGRFCVIMPMRVTIPAGINDAASTKPPLDTAAVAA
jgi:DNA polymerase III sliding clamp (beta) subunit (PCNA family)